MFLLPRGTTLPSPPPPGLTVVPADGAAEAEGAGAAIAGVLGVRRCATVEEASALLARRRADAVAGATEHLRAAAVAAATARASVEKVRLSLSTVPAGLTAATVRSALHTVAEGVEAVREARDAVGGRPGHDAAAAATARAAQADVEQARRDRAAALPRANRILTMANAAAVVVVAARLASEAFDRLFVLVAVLPVAALGYAGYTVVAPIRRARAAARRRWSALRSMNVSTLAGLDALEERAGAWERRSARLTAAEADLRIAREAWRSLVGDGVALASAERLAADLEVSAVREEAAAAASHAWVGAALALQAAEDAPPAGEPVVVLDPDPDADSKARWAAVRRLAALAGATPVVLVVAEPPPAPAAAVDDDGAVTVEPPETAPAWPAPALVPYRRPAASRVPAAAGDGSAIVDLRERVKAGLLRLRARSSAPRDPSAPDSATG